jgi:hypothetical protein
MSDKLREAIAAVLERWPMDVTLPMSIEEDLVAAVTPLLEQARQEAMFNGEVRHAMACATHGRCAFCAAYLHTMPSTRRAGEETP